MSDAAPPRLGWWLSSEEHDPRELVADTVRAEQIGLRTVVVSDHLQPWVRRQGHSPFVWTVIGAIAQATDAVEVGTGVTAMVRRSHPVNVAQAAATAAVMLDGRFFLGVGTGERLNEQPFGERWPRAGERREQLCESIQIIRALWRGENVNHRGRWWSVENLRLPTRPAEPPPIHVAAGGARSARVAGEVGDGMIGVVADARLVDVFHGSGGAGKRCIGKVTASIAATEEAAVEQACEWWPHGAVAPALLAELAKPSDFEAAAEGLPPERLRDTVVCAADAGPVITAIDRFVAAGYDTVYVHQVGSDQSRLADVFRTELLPHYGR
jgi:coenzyme F420-dependent glucose-6-phosphate dehydrogenase